MPRPAIHEIRVQPSRLSGAALLVWAILLPAAAGAQTSVVSDFDRDHKPDLAVATQVFSRLKGSVYSVQVHRTGTTSISSFELSAGAGGLSLKTRDVDGDHDVDLVISTIAGEHVGVWLNDGSGQFSRGVAGEYPDWIWGDLPEFDVRERHKLLEAGIAVPNKLPVLGTDLPCCGEEPRAPIPPIVRFIAPHTCSSPRHFIRPPPSPLFS